MSKYVRIRDGMSNATEGDLSGLINDVVTQGGVLSIANDHFMVEENDTPDMTLKVAEGLAYLPNDSWSEFSSEARYWQILMDAGDTVSISSNASGSTRVDIVALYLNTATSPDANASNVVTIEVIEGTPGGGAPAIPANYLGLAEVSVANGATSITNSDITDIRDQIQISADLLNTGSGDVVFENAIQILTNKTLTSPKIGTAILDTSANELLKVTATASAVNELTLANAAAGGTPAFTATGDDTNINAALYGKGEGVTKGSSRYQSNTTNSTVTGLFFQSGWGFFVGNGTSTANEAVTFPTAFPNACLGVSMTTIGYKDGSDPANINDFGNFNTVGQAYNLSTSGFTATVNATSGTYANTRRVGYIWHAWGY